MTPDPLFSPTIKNIVAAIFALQIHIWLLTPFVLYRNTFIVFYDVLVGLTLVAALVWPRVLGQRLKFVEHLLWYVFIIGSAFAVMMTSSVIADSLVSSRGGSPIVQDLTEFLIFMPYIISCAGLDLIGHASGACF